MYNSHLEKLVFDNGTSIDGSDYWMATPGLVLGNGTSVTHLLFKIYSDTVELVAFDENSQMCNLSGEDQDIAYSFLRGLGYEMKEYEFVEIQIPASQDNGEILPF